ncbi:MAG: hypothetical protein OXQ92_14150 [Boseongicola sp.]|nr:hypothetical protein [Boseongicola sp.]MDD9978908.1 hypothetical protein [Boseongicola sp.]
MAVLIYRWIVFGLAAGYLVYLLIIDGDYSAVGGPFRFLTIWALLFTFFSMSRMMAIMEGRSDRDWPATVAVTGALNFMVVFLYWRLYFDNPANVRSDGEITWWIEYYVHALGPLLQWIDMLFIHRNIRGFRRAIALMAATIVAYVAWIELVVQRFNDAPFGSVTSGLPYPFLNNLDVSGRAAFYGQTAVMAVVMLLVIFGLGRLLRKAKPADRPDMSDAKA